MTEEAHWCVCTESLMLHKFKPSAGDDGAVRVSAAQGALGVPPGAGHSAAGRRRRQLLRPRGSTVAALRRPVQGRSGLPLTLPLDSVYGHLWLG